LLTSKRSRPPPPPPPGEAGAAGGRARAPPPAPPPAPLGRARRSTADTSGPFWIGRITVSSSSTPPPNDSAIVTANAGQNAQPWSISVQQTNAESVAISPCAKLSTPVAR